MKIFISASPEAPIYQQIAESMKKDMRSGILPPGCRLPTVRELAEENGVAKGTVKHAYDILEREGLLEKRQGKGTFVCQPSAEQNLGKKDRATLAIDGLLDQLEALGFSLRDARIILELKLREREQSFRHVRIGAVDCSPEALSVITDQLAGFSGADVFEYLLQPVLDSPAQFDPGWDIYITTPTHFQQLSEKMPAGSPLIQLVLSVSAETVLELAGIEAEGRTEILCGSRRFGEIIKRACRQYGRLAREPRVFYFGGGEITEDLLRNTERVILPPNYFKFSTPSERELLARYGGTEKIITFQYRIERGSLLYLAEQIDKVRDLIRGLE